jgi:hypothetical protein
VKNPSAAAKAEELSVAASRNANQVQHLDTDGRLMGILSIAVAPGAVLLSPTFFALGSFFLGLLGLTVAHPKQRYLSFIGIALAGVCGGIGYFYNTPII